MRREVSHLVMKLKWIFIKVQYNIYRVIASFRVNGILGQGSAPKKP